MLSSFKSGKLSIEDPMGNISILSYSNNGDKISLATEKGIPLSLSNLCYVSLECVGKGTDFKNGFVKGSFKEAYSISKKNDTIETIKGNFAFLMGMKFSKVTLL